MPSNLAFSKAVQGEFDKVMAKKKQELWDSLNPFGSPPLKKEAPMETTTNLGKAKKQRDVARNQLQMAINKIAEAHPAISRFEIAHAIADSVLSSIDTQARHSGTVSMPFLFGSTILPYTTTMINEAGGACAPPQPAQNTSILDYVHGSNVPYYAPGPAFKGAPKKGNGGLKLDTQVTENDCIGYVYGTYKQYSEAKKNIEGSVPVTYYPAVGTTWIGGYNKVLYVVPALSPYLTSKTISEYNLKPYSGFKFRKLKNKSLYKIVKLEPKVAPKPYGKNVVATSSYPGTISKSPDYVTCKKVGFKEPVYLKLDTTYTGQMAKQISPPTGYYWKKNISSDTATLCKVPTTHTYKLYDVVDLDVAQNNPAPAGTHWEHKNTTVGKAVLMSGEFCPDTHNIKGPHPFPNGWMNGAKLIHDEF